MTATLLLLLAESARGDNPFLNSYRYRPAGMPDSGEEVAKRIREGSAGGDRYGRLRGELSGSAAAPGWRASPVLDDRRCASYCLVAVRGEFTGRRALRSPPSRPAALFEDLLAQGRGGVAERIWFWDGRGTRRMSATGAPGPEAAEARTFFWDGSVSVRAMGSTRREALDPGQVPERGDESGRLPDEEVYYWRGLDGSEIARTMKVGLEAISGGAPAWFVSTAGYWEVFSWSGSTSFQVTGNSVHEMFLRHGDRTLTMMESLNGTWEEDVDQLANPSDWLLYLIRNQGAMEAMERARSR